MIINTEAHIFPRFELGQLFSTGWKRKPRDANGKIIGGQPVATVTAAETIVHTATITHAETHTA